GAARGRREQGPAGTTDEIRREHQLSGADPGVTALLGGARLRDPAALRYRGRRRHVSSGDGVARLGPGAVARRLCPAVAPADRRPLWRKPEPAAALLSAAGDPEAGPGRQPGTVSEEPGGARDRRL